MPTRQSRLLLLIDDDPAQGRLVSALAAREGWRTIVAPDSDTAIAMLGTRDGMQTAAIILDQWVPGNGQKSILDQFRCGMEAPEDKL